MLRLVESAGQGPFHLGTLDRFLEQSLLSLFLLHPGSTLYELLFLPGDLSLELFVFFGQILGLLVDDVGVAPSVDER